MRSRAHRLENPGTLALGPNARKKHNTHKHTFVNAAVAAAIALSAITACPIIIVVVMCGFCPAAAGEFVP